MLCIELGIKVLSSAKLMNDNKNLGVFVDCFGFWIDICGNWIEIAYGTRSGSVRVIVQHPETVGHGPQLFQTFTVHQSPVTKVSYLTVLHISGCFCDGCFFR